MERADPVNAGTHPILGWRNHIETFQIDHFWPEGAFEQGGA
jgi:hypothetical protein